MNEFPGGAEEKRVIQKQKKTAFHPHQCTEAEKERRYKKGAVEGYEGPLVAELLDEQRIDNCEQWARNLEWTLLPRTLGGVVTLLRAGGKGRGCVGVSIWSSEYE